MIYGAALFTVMKCHGLMKSPGKQIPGFKNRICSWRNKGKVNADKKKKKKRIHHPLLKYSLFLLMSYTVNIAVEQVVNQL